VLARQVSLEVIPICQMGVFALLFGVYLLAMRPNKSLETSAAPVGEQKSLVQPD
jgi:hypothetical protein